METSEGNLEFVLAMTLIFTVVAVFGFIALRIMRFCMNVIYQTFW